MCKALFTCEIPIHMCVSHSYVSGRLVEVTWVMGQYFLCRIFKVPDPISQCMPGMCTHHIVVTLVPPEISKIISERHYLPTLH